MPSPTASPQATETVVARGIRAIVLENDLVSTTVLIDQGADIHTLVYKPSGIDVLWKPPRPPREPGVGPTPAGDSLAVWNSYYRGGWNVIFPNFGPSVEHRGATLDFHGEAARTAWQLVDVRTLDRSVDVTLATTLIKSPFRISRTMSLKAGQPVLEVTETVTNDGTEESECMWGHHPVFGEPLLSPESVIDTGARIIELDDGSEVPDTDLAVGGSWAWPVVRNRRGEDVDMSRVPGPGTGFTRVLYLKDFTEGWYALTNPSLEIGVGLVWDSDLFPYACFWQETGKETGHPFFGKAYTTAIEPFSSYPGLGLPTAMRKTGTHLTFAPGQSRTLELKAVVFEGSERVSGITPSGAVMRA